MPPATIPPYGGRQCGAAGRSSVDHELASCGPCRASLRLSRKQAILRPNPASGEAGPVPMENREP